MAVSMKVKEALIQRLAFPKLLTHIVELLVISFRVVYIKINKQVVVQVLMTQVVTKASNINKINFQILQMI